MSTNKARIDYDNDTRPLHRTRLGWATDWRGRLGWAMVDLGDWLHGAAWDVTRGQTPEPGVPNTNHLQWIAAHSGRKVSDIMRDMEGAR